MNNTKPWILSLGAVAAAAALLAAPGAVNGQKATARKPAGLVEADHIELQKLRAELARVQERIAARLAAIELATGRHLEQNLARLEGLKEMELTHLLPAEEAKLAQELAHAEHAAGPAQAKLERELAEAHHALEAGQAKLAQELAWVGSPGQEPQVWVSGESDSGWLGVSISEVTAEKAKELKLPAERGALINHVESDSPASKGGLKAGDVITEFAGQRVEGAVQLRRFIRETPPGRAVQLTVWRDGRALQISVTLEDYAVRIRGRIRDRVAITRPNFNFGFAMPQLDLFRMGARPTLGIQTQDLDGQLGSYFAAPDGEGVLVQHVNSGSPAEKAGMKAGDVIVKVEGARVRSSSELRERLRDHREKKSVALAVLRKGAETTLNVEVQQPPPRPAVRSGRRVAI